MRHGVINIFGDDIPMYNNIMTGFHWSGLPVDFFFIISGFFLFLTTNFNQNYADFAKKNYSDLCRQLFSC